MPRGGARPGAGRKKGQLNKLTEERVRHIARAAADGITPLEVLLRSMRSAWDEQRTQDAVAYAIAAAPYVHPRLAAVEHSGETTTNVISAQPELKPEEWAHVHADAGSTAH